MLTKLDDNTIVAMLSKLGEDTGRRLDDEARVPTYDSSDPTGSVRERSRKCNKW